MLKVLKDNLLMHNIMERLIYVTYADVRM